MTKWIFRTSSIIVVLIGFYFELNIEDFWLSFGLYFVYFILISGYVISLLLEMLRWRQLKKDWRSIVLIILSATAILGILVFRSDILVLQERVTFARHKEDLEAIVQIATDVSPGTASNQYIDLPSNRFKWTDVDIIYVSYDKTGDVKFITLETRYSTLITFFSNQEFIPARGCITRLDDHWYVCGDWF